jgi:hypothetical protein
MRGGTEFLQHAQFQLWPASNQRSIESWESDNVTAGSGVDYSVVYFNDKAIMSSYDSPKSQYRPLQIATWPQSYTGMLDKMRLSLSPSTYDITVVARGSNCNSLPKRFEIEYDDIDNNQRLLLIK